MRSIAKGFLLTALIIGSFWVGFHVDRHIDPVDVYEVDEYRDNVRLKDGTYVASDKLLTPHVEEFFEEAYKYGYDVDSIFNNFEGLYVDKLPTGTIGQTFFSNEYIPHDFCLIDEDIKDNYNRVRLVVFHELAHILFGYSAEHCHWMCPEIFSANGPINYYGQDWERQKEVLFQRIPHWKEN